MLPSLLVLLTQTLLWLCVGTRFLWSCASPTPANSASQMLPSPWITGLWPCSCAFQTCKYATKYTQIIFSPPKHLKRRGKTLPGPMWRKFLEARRTTVILQQPLKHWPCHWPGFQANSNKPKQCFPEDIWSDHRFSLSGTLCDSLSGSYYSVLACISQHFTAFQPN